MQQGTQITWQTNLPLNFKVYIKMVEFLDAAEEEVKVAKKKRRKDFLAMVDKVCVEIARGTCRGEQRESRNAVKLPPNFMSYRWRSDSGG
ncbi:hypothetical protein HID58_065795 [Brassica napus]|uniref:Uncharacterized protein n=1 Tax=Brassica napus TaxID=3708 RepID=A0ABQ7ZDU9_BRANA|nr:hypothetical protein HID58_065795 [Brassica napus]